MSSETNHWQPFCFSNGWMVLVRLMLPPVVFSEWGGEQVTIMTPAAASWLEVLRIRPRCLVGGGLHCCLARFPLPRVCSRSIHHCSAAGATNVNRLLGRTEREGKQAIRDAGEDICFPHILWKCAVFVSRSVAKCEIYSPY